MVHPVGEHGTPVAAPVIFDPTVLVRLGRELGDARVALRVAQRFIDLLPMRVRRLEAALADSDLDRALDVVLMIKVTAATVGGRELHRASGQVECSVRALQWSGASSALAAVKGASGPLRRELSAYLQVQAAVL